MLLSLDISSKSTGFALINSNGSLIKYGVYSSKHPDFLERANHMAEQIRLLLSLNPVTEVVIEELKVLKNQKTLVVLAIVQGIILRELYPLPVTFVSPNTWRKDWQLTGLKRPEAKKQAIALCERNGWKVSCDDDAEAILIGRYFYGHRGSLR